MVAAAAATAAGWTIEQIAAGVGIAGTVGGGVSQVAASGDKGWNFHGPSGNIHYPKEVGPQLFLGDEHRAGGTLLRFFADGYIWNNECFVRYHGIFSNSNEPPMCYSNGNSPHVPANRFLEVGFEKGGEELSSGLLNCGLSTYETGVAGQPEAPSIIIHCGGKFDPVGSGEADFSFNVYIDTYAQVALGEIYTKGSGLEIVQAGSQVDVKLNQ